MTRYQIKQQPTKCGMTEVKRRIFKKVETNKKIWYIPIQDNVADDLHVFIKGTGKLDYFEGYGGAIIDFLLEDGTIDKVKGPWHSNPDSLLQDTGIDVRDKTITIGAIGRSRVFDDDNEFIEDILHEDKDWVLGSFRRIKNMAQQFADELGIKIWYYSQSSGGFTTGWADPTK